MIDDIHFKNIKDIVYPWMFLTPHTGKGKLAAAYYLSANWKLSYGGCLHFLKKRTDEVTDVIVPRFNTLVLFKVPKEGKPHMVSGVTSGVKEKD